MKKHLSAEHRAKISAANRGRKRSHEIKIKMSLARRAMLRKRAKSTNPYGEGDPAEIDGT